MNISNIGQSALKAWFGPGSIAATAAVGTRPVPHPIGLM